MAAEVVDLRTRPGFVPAEPDEDRGPQPPDGLTFEQQQIWWDGYTTAVGRKEQAAKTFLVGATQFFADRQQSGPLGPAS
ncbi:hypothetical protein [Plantactinospora sp. WMMB782]|uniref:hypothetical protein n=1 Tax=Plantactinospora sp. WMMB782 TaxID=3404121 RepID=UPI003B957F2A